MQPWTGPQCDCCGLPFASARPLDSSSPKCGGCRKNLPAFDGARSYGIYAGNLRQAILRLKFSREERLGARLGAMLRVPWESLPVKAEFGPALIVPVPLHRLRRRERGFNQSELLADGLIRTWKRHGAAAPELAAGGLVRQRATPPQTGLSVSARRENLRGAFEVPAPEVVRQRVLVLVDDVMTTGATLSACARALRRAGAAQILGLTVARATPQFPDLARADNDNTVDGLDRDST